MTNLKLALATGLAAATLAVVLTYVLGAQAILQSPYAEPAHDQFMSLKEGIAGPESQMHGTGGQASEESTMQGMNRVIIGNNILGSPAGDAAGGLATVVVISAIALAAAVIVVS